MNSDGTYAHRSFLRAYKYLKGASAWPGHLPPWTHMGAVCKTVGLSKGIRKNPDVAPPPNPAVYENQGGSAPRRRARRIHAGLAALRGRPRRGAAGVHSQVLWLKPVVSGRR